MFKAYKYRIYPNFEQECKINKTFGICRYIYNWALNLKNKRYQEFKQNINRFELGKMVTFFKETNERNWIAEANSQSIQAELLHLENAFNNFFKHNSSYPTFKKKSQKQTFECPQRIRINFHSKTITIPKIGEINYRDNQIFEGEIKKCTVSKNKAQEYYISILVNNYNDTPTKLPINNSIGIDVGLKHFAVLSTGEKIENPKYLRNKQIKLKIYQRRLARKKKGGRNWIKQKIKVAKVHNDIVNQRKDFLHKLTTNIIKNHDTIFVEDLNIKGMVKNHKLARAISDASWSEFFRQLNYKSEWNGNNLIKIGRFEPSSKLCTCGYINNNLTLNDREWECPSCKSKHDRDILAANNIKRMGLIKTRQGMSEEPVDILQEQMVEAGNSLVRKELLKLSA